MPESRHRRRPERRSTQLPSSRPSRPQNHTRLLIISILATVVIALGGGLVITLVPADRLLNPFGERPGLVEGVGAPVDLMGSRSHFLTSRAIHDVEPGGYNSSPPTSGRHWSHWEKCGFYRGGMTPGTRMIPDESIVHNMEHGHIVLSYNLGDPAQVDRLERIYDALPEAERWMVARWYDGIPEGGIALTAWGVIDRWNVKDNPQGLDRDRIARFLETYRGVLGPEFPNGSPCS